MKILNITLATLISTVLVACATSTGKPVDVVDADKSKGVVSVGFIHTENLPLMDNGEGARWDEALGIAEGVCKKWGYTGAEQLTKYTKREGVVNGYGQLMNGAIYYKYQCIGNLNNKDAEK